MSEKLKMITAKRQGGDLSDFVEVPESEALETLQGFQFCSGFVERLSDAIGAEFSNRIFFRWSKQPEDIHIAWGIDHPLAIQIDNLCEVICGFGAEYGPWDSSKDATSYFLEEYFKQTKKHS